MSGAALGWAWKQPVPSASAKFVLVLLADQTTGDLAFMAVNTIAARTGLDRKTVMGAVARLIEWQLIEETGERRGRTGSVPVYRLLMNDGLFDNAPHATESSTKNGTGTKTGTASEAVPVLPGSGTSFPTKRYQKRDTDPKSFTQELDPSRVPGARAHTREGPPTATAGAVATIAMREAGMPLNRLNPSHPELLSALAAGITPAELADVTREIANRPGHDPPNLVYVVRTAVGRHREAVAAKETSHVAAEIRSRGSTRNAPDRPRSVCERVEANIRNRREREAAAAAPVTGGDG